MSKAGHWMPAPDRIRIFGDYMEWFVRQDAGEFSGHVDGTIKRQRAFESVDFKCDCSNIFT